jgi:hypothetical protein
MLAGIRAGQRRFRDVSQQLFRRHLLNLLIVISLPAPVRAAIDSLR